jgi:hypothetical protein
VRLSLDCGRYREGVPVDPKTLAKTASDFARTGLPEGIAEAGACAA